MKYSFFRKAGALLLALTLCLTMMPMSVYADEAPAAEAADDGNTEISTAAETRSGDVIEDAAAEVQEDVEGGGDTELPPQEIGDDEGETSGTVIEDPYGRVSFIDAYDGEYLILPESMANVKVSKPKFGNGLLLSGTAGDFKDRIALDADFDLNGSKVQRIAFDGLADRGVIIDVNIYLDNSETPAATVRLKNQMGKNSWSTVGDQSADVYDLDVVGKHRVSFDVAFKDGETEEPLSDGKKAEVLIRSIEFCESSIPVMYFNIDESKGSIAAMNSSEDHSAECYGTVDLKVPDGFISEYNGKQQDNLTGVKLEYIRGRGNSTWAVDKKPYKVKFDKGQNLFGMGKNKHWILLANRYDNSLIRNRMTYWLGEQLGMDYTPQCIPVDVIMNGEYFGSYLLCEQIRVDESRVDIVDLEDTPDETELDKITGGYILSMDPAGDNDPYRLFRTTKGMSFTLESPSFEDYENDAQRLYIQNYVQHAEDAIFGTDFKDEDGNSYTEFIDMDSFAKYWWMQEFSENGDAYVNGSTFLYKKENDKLYWGPLWDFDYVAWGDLDYDSDPRDGFQNTSTAWSTRLMSDSAFTDKLTECWKDQLRDLMLEVTGEGGLLDKYYDQTRTSWKYDHEKWGEYNDYWSLDDGEEEIRTYEQEIEQLRLWIERRFDWVEENIDELSPATVTVKFMVNGKVVAELQGKEGYPLENIPEAPKKKGYVYLGWISDDGDVIDSYTEVYYDMVVTPYYIKESEVVKPEKLYLNTYEVYVPYFSSDDEEYYYIDYTVSPSDAVYSKLEWTSSDPYIASVDEYGTVQYFHPGTAVITAKVSDSVSASLILHVVPLDETQYPDDLVLNKTKMTLINGEEDQLVAYPDPLNGGYLDVTWICLDEDIAMVNDIGVVYACGVGTTYIVAYDNDNGYYQKCKVTVKNPAAPKLTLTSNVSKKQVKASWKAVKGAVKYKVAYRKAGASKWTYKTTTKTNYTVKNLKKGGLYQFKVRAIGKQANSKWSSVQRVYLNKKSVTLKAGKKSVKVTWKKTAKASKYQILWSYSSKMTKAKTINVSKSKTTYTIKNLKKGKRVYVKIRALRTYKGKTYKGVLSAVKSVKTL